MKGIIMTFIKKTVSFIVMAVLAAICTLALLITMGSTLVLWILS